MPLGPRSIERLGTYVAAIEAVVKGVFWIAVSAFLLGYLVCDGGDDA